MLSSSFEHEDGTRVTNGGVVRPTPNGYEVIFERQIPHSPTRVWAMLTEPDNIETWLCARVDIDGRRGGRMVEHHDHVAMDVPGEIVRWEPSRVFEHSWWIGDSQEAPQGSVLWELFPERSGTRLVFTDRRQTLVGMEGAIAGRHICLDVLAAVLDGADPNAHVPPFGEFQDGNFAQSRAGLGRWSDGPKLEMEYRRVFASIARPQ